ncbi:MAG: hypothetical protein HXX18_01245 [Bacteroidetes bacterium]|nr:hypothetical protein [Bacteroidota bacterium]
MILPNRHSIRLKGYDYSQAGMYFITICCKDRIHRFGNIADGKMILNEAGKIATAEWGILKDRFQNIKQGAFVVMPNHIHFIIIITHSVVQAGLAPAPKPTYNSVGATLAVARRDDTDKTIIAVARRDDTDKTTHAIAHRDDTTQYNTDETNDIVRAGLAPAQKETGDREGRPDEYKGLGEEGDRKGRPNETDRKITIGEIVGAYKSLVFNKCLILAKERNEYLGKFWQRDFFENIIRNDEAFIKISEYIINNPAKWRDDKFYIE